MKPKLEGLDTEQLVDEIVDEILEKTHVKKQEPEKKEIFSKDLVLDKLKARIENLENRVDKHINNYKITAIEVERQISEKSSEMEQDYEVQIMRLQSQIEDLRTAMIRLSNEFKKFKENIK